MNIRNKISALLVILLFLAIGNPILSMVIDNEGEEKAEWVIRKHNVLVEIKNLLSLMTDAETGQRGFLLTGDPTYLEPYLHGVRLSKESLDRLFRMESNNIVQKEYLFMIKDLMVKKFDVLSVTVSLRRTGNTENIRSAMDIVKMNSGRDYMDSIRKIIVQFENEERVLLRERESEYKETKVRITTLIVIQIIFILFIGMFIIFFIKNRLFDPIEMMLKNTKKIENGEKQDIKDIVSQDEMGYLLSSFYKMSEKVLFKTNKLTYDATHDHLTGLNNRAKMNEIISDAIAGLVGNDKKIAVYFIDLDEFKKCNDSLGHDIGDAILKETGDRLKKLVRSDDSVFRLGGDEFVIVAENIDQALYAEILATKILTLFKQPFIFKGNSIIINMSIGIAVSPDDSTNSREILKLSDIAMYAAKSDKGNCYRLFDKAMLKSKNNKTQ